ncbi:MAG TPA: ubiquinol-cytochrome C chaperone family protein [Beijerinckiaceae bacterium]|nr:ubiquinol-cytochrome C chaperone family protein [Beijerinckiaceae bacterium]
MVLGFFRKDPRRGIIETLYQRVAAASRHPALYERLGIPDTVEGRFESVALHLILVLRRLRTLPNPADEVAQDLVDAFFRHLDHSLRELAVGDLAVPKRMKKLAEAFNGRSLAYDAALQQADDDGLGQALARNVIGAGRPAEALAAYVRASEARLAELDLAALLDEGPRFAAPAARESAP